MSIILFLGRNVKEYTECVEQITEKSLTSGRLLCELCLLPLKRHSNYKRGIKETGEKLRINIVRCKPCNKGHALLPDFLLPGKHYGGNEIESVIIDSASLPMSEIETEASEPTVRRWIAQIGDGIKRACGIIKYLFKQSGKAISELSIATGTAYSELEQLLEKAPKPLKSSGNKLGLANLWIGTNEVRAYI
jgi:hypothetical protein